MHQESLDARISRVAAAQFGVVSRAQALAAGATPAQIQRRIQTGRWERVHPGVYAITGHQAGWHREAMAACLSCGEHAVVGGAAAARLWDLGGFERAAVEILVPRGPGGRRKPFRVRTATDLSPPDVGRLRGIPVTSVARTLIDVAAREPAALVEDALDDALRRRLTGPVQLRRRIQSLARRGSSGPAALLAMLDARVPPASATQNLFEARLLRGLTRAGLPLPVPQYPVRAGGRAMFLDFAYPDHQLALEAESYRWHSGRRQWERDVERRNILTALGWRIVSVTWWDLERRLPQTMERIARLLAATAIASARERPERGR